MEQSEDTAKRLPGRYHAATIARFEHSRVQAEHTQRSGAHEAFLLQLLEEHLQRHSPTLNVGDFYTALALSEEHIHALESVLASTGMNRTDFLRRVLLKEIDAHQRRTTRIYALDLNDPENRSRRAGAGYQYLRQKLQELMDRNVQAAQWFEHLFITPEQLAKHSGSNPQLVRRFLRDHAAMVQDHHETMGWHTAEEGKSHNHKAGNHVRDLAREARKGGHHDAALLADVLEVMDAESDYESA